MFYSLVAAVGLRDIFRSKGQQLHCLRDYHRYFTMISHTSRDLTRSRNTKLSSDQLLNKKVHVTNVTSVVEM